jgi:hypothetical protein
LQCLIDLLSQTEKQNNILELEYDETFTITYRTMRRIGEYA